MRKKWGYSASKRILRQLASMSSDTKEPGMAEQEVFEDIRYRYGDGAVAKGRHSKEIRDDFRTSLKIPSGRNYSAKGRLDRKGYTRRRVSASRLLIEVQDGWADPSGRSELSSRRSWCCQALHWGVLRCGSSADGVLGRTGNKTERDWLYLKDSKQAESRSRLSEDSTCFISALARISTFQ